MSPQKSIIHFFPPHFLPLFSNPHPLQKNLKFLQFPRHFGHFFAAGGADSALLEFQNGDDTGLLTDARSHSREKKGRGRRAIWQRRLQPSGRVIAALDISKIREGMRRTRGASEGGGLPGRARHAAVQTSPISQQAVSLLALEPKVDIKLNIQPAIRSRPRFGPSARKKPNIAARLKPTPRFMNGCRCWE